MSMLLRVGSEDVSAATSLRVGPARNDYSSSTLVIEPILAGTASRFFSARLLFPGLLFPSLFSNEAVTSEQGLAPLTPASAERMRLQ
ncbi:hypothetical protein [Ferrimicrobium acidiphilum]|uniref:hypothetical protein n=1 Tax=Ferrimicrobium acidiphilum TaxID=121039 RepID=UPI0023F06515|nr:hypothetical protein [Ferrimicrobium acidiphilum]